MADTLWKTADAIKQERANRIAMLPRLLLPLFDIDQASAVTLASKAVDGAALTSSVATYYTSPSGAGKVAEVLSITICNTDAAGQAVEIYLIESGGSAGVATSIFRDTLQAGESVLPEGPWFLGPGDTLQAKAATGAVVSLRAEVLEWAANPAGLVLKVINGVSLGSTVSSYYTCPASTDAIVLAATFCNTDTASRTINYHIIHSGDSAAVKNRVASDALAAKETAIYGGARLLKPSDFVQAKADSASVVGARFTVLEVTQ